MRALPAIIFMSRWLQVPLYLGLIVAQGVYVVLFLKEVWHLVTASMTLDETSRIATRFHSPEGARLNAQPTRSVQQAPLSPLS